VIEGVLESIAIEITNKISAPTIGIGASAQCDGQVLVSDDMLGMFDRVPKFVKRYGDLATQYSAAAKEYASDVRDRSFPTQDQIYKG
jgi:3-methyl-2-oxobutanoate hydroxymethyltransferase